MPPRKCTGCGHPLGATDTYCPVCGRIQLPVPEERLDRFARMPLWMIVGLILLVLIGIFGMVALVLLGLERLL